MGDEAEGKVWILRYLAQVLNSPSYGLELEEESYKELVRQGDIELVELGYDVDLNYDIRLDNAHVISCRNVSFKGNNLYFDARFGANIIYLLDGKVVHRTYMKYVYLQCEAVLDKTLNKLLVLGVSATKFPERLIEGSIKADGDLVPLLLRDNDLTTLANALLEEVFPYGIYSATPLPIEEILENEGITICRDYELNEDAILAFDDCEISTKNGIVKVPAYTILLQSDRHGKCAKFPLTHEFVHLRYHKNFFEIRNLALDSEVFTFNDDTKPSGLVEWQANMIAAKMLMNGNSLLEVLVDLYEKYNFPYCDNRDEAMRDIECDISDIYQVSKQCAAKRIKDFNFLLFNTDPEKIYTTYIKEDFIVETYNKDIVFKELIDTGAFVYNNGQFVLNDEKYICGNQITYYAYGHQEECFIKFSKTYRNSRVYRHTLHRENMTKEWFCRIQDNKLVLENAKALGLNDLVKDDEYKDLFSDDIGTTIKRIMDKAGYNSYALQQDSGVDRNTISGILDTTYKNLAIDKLAMICRTLRVPISGLYKLIGMVKPNLDATYEDLMIKKTIDKYYEDESITPEEFKNKLEIGKNIAKLINNARWYFN